MIRQYIGARYVTKIYENSLDPSSAEWESGVTYEPLTLVTYLNSSYLSKKEVPGSVGDPAANPSYWVVTGAYNGQIAQLQNDIAAINDRFNRYFVFQGDSYTNDWDYTWPVWTEIIVSNLGLTSDDYEVMNNDGAGFSDSGMYGTFQQQLEATTFRKTPTDILIAAGTNERGHTYNEIHTAIKAYVAKAKELYPDARIWISMIGWSTTESVETELTNTILRAYMDGATESGAIWIDGPTYSLTLGSEMYDSLHPNATGQLYIGDALSDAIIGGSYNASKFKTLTLTPESGISIQNNATVYANYQQNGSICKIRLKNTITKADSTPYVFATPVTLSSSWFKLGTFDDSILNPGKIQWTSSIVVHDNDYHVDMAVFRIEENGLYMSTSLGSTGVDIVYVPNADAMSFVRTLT